MTRDEIFNKLKELFAMSVKNPASFPTDITEEANLNTDLGMTSVNLLYLVIAIEETFRISFDDVGLGEFETVRDVIDYIVEN